MSNPYSCSIIPFIIISLLLSSQGNVTFSCAEPVSVAVTFSDSHSYLSLPGADSRMASVAMQFRTWNRVGLLLTFGLSTQWGAVWLYVHEARLRLLVRKHQRNIVELSAGWCDAPGQLRC